MLLLALIFGFASISQVKSNCYIEGVSDITWMYGYYNDEIEDNYEGVVKTFNIQNITDARVLNITYLNAYIKEDQLIIYTTNRFEIYEEENANSPTIDVIISLLCTGDEDKEFKFYQKIEDVNNHKPTFFQDEYMFKFAMDVPKGLTLTEFVDVKVEDIDVTNSRVWFSFEENDYLEVSTVKYNEGKYYFPEIKTKRAIELPFRRSFTLIAEDDDTPSLNSSTIITLVLIRPEDVVPAAIFEKPAYTATYNRDTSILEFSEGISLKQGQGSDYQIIQTGLNEYISVEMESKEEGRFVVKKLKDLPDEIISGKYEIIDIIAHNDNSLQNGKTSLIIFFE